MTYKLDGYVDVPTRLRMALERFPDLRVQETGHQMIELAVLADVVGLFGGALVLASFDIGFVQFYYQLLGAVGTTDFVIGIIKAAVFGLAIAAIGCERGLTTGAGATSVGLSATSAVVTSIVWIVVIDGIFTVLTS